MSGDTTPVALDTGPVDDAHASGGARARVLTLGIDSDTGPSTNTNDPAPASTAANSA
jgi:hypothetical protein